MDFDLWNGESEHSDGPWVKRSERRGLAYEDQDMVVDVKSKEVPPCMILKSDGAAFICTTDLAHHKRMEKYQPDDLICGG